MSKKTKKKNKTVEQAEAWVAIKDAEADANPKSVGSIIWKALGKLYVPIACYALLGIIIIASLVCIFVPSDLFKGILVGALGATLFVTTWATIEHIQGKY